MINSNQAPSGFYLALALALLVPALSAQSKPGPVGRLVGQVRSEELSTVLEGVEVVALLEGVSVAGTALTDENGHYEIALQQGDYDVRAVARAQPLIAGIARDVRLDPGNSSLVDFELRPTQAGLVEVGIDPEWLLDTDLDGVPDLAERKIGSDHRQADTDMDGISDGLISWVEGDAKLGPAHTNEAPLITWPEPGAALPLLGAVPIELLFRPVPGATGYRLRVESVDEELAYEEDHDIADGELLLGESCALRWFTPDDFIPGPYALTIQAYYRTPGQWLGKRAALHLELFAVEDLQPVVLHEEREIKGWVLATSIHITPEARLTVPPGEWLHLVATEEILIEQEAQLLGAPGEEEEPPSNISLSCGGDVRVFGWITSGAGLAGKHVHTPPSGYGSPSHATATPGGVAGDVVISARGRLTVGREGHIASGTGGPGGNARAEADPGYDALAIAGAGGPGGNLVLHTGELVLADRPQRVVSGPGGPGGHATARGGDGSIGERSGLSSALPGVGGDAGDLWLSRINLRADGFIALQDPDFPIAGGVAGVVGEANPIKPVKGKPKNKTALDGYTHKMICGMQGGGGWMLGGNGQTAVAIGGEGLNAGSGGLAIATSGPGGRVRRLGLPFSATRCVLAFTPQAGAGGLAQATGGEGGFSATTAHGAGGSAEARGGLGGPGLLFASHFLTRGGAGGPTEAFGSPGHHGVSRCPMTGQDGSDGGVASAYGGQGGDSNGIGGNGGSATATGADGGGGGRGNPPGRAGKGGDGRTSTEKIGVGLIANGEQGAANYVHGELGQRGAKCPKN